MSAENAAERARASYGSLLDYYFERPASKELITIGIRVGDIPNTGQAEQLQKDLADSLRAKEIIDSITPEEKENMERLAFISKSRREKRRMNK